MDIKVYEKALDLAIIYFHGKLYFSLN